MSRTATDLTIQSKLSEWLIVSYLVLIVTIAAVVAMLAVGPWSEFREDTVKRLISPTVPVTQVAQRTPLLPSTGLLPTRLNGQSEEALLDFFKAPTVSGLVVSTLDMNKNQFTNTFEAHREDTEAPTEITEKQSPTYAVFGETPALNIRIMNLLQGDMDCRSLSEMEDFRKYLPNGNDVEWSCAVSLPPTQHRANQWFGGFLTVLLQKQPSATVEKQIMKMATNASVVIAEQVKAESDAP